MRINFHFRYLFLNNYKSAFLLPLLLSFCISCSDYSEKTISLNEFLKAVNQPVIGRKKQVYVLTIVENGCHSCSEEVLEYTKRLGSFESLHFIFSATTFKKLTIALSDKKLVVKGIVKDGKYLAKSMNLIPETSIAYFTFNKKIIKSEEINSENSTQVFDEIAQFLGKKFNSSKIKSNVRWSSIVT